MSGLKNQKYRLPKLERADPKKWKGLTQKTRSTEPKKWEGLI